MEKDAVIDQIGNITQIMDDFHDLFVPNALTHFLNFHDDEGVEEFEDSYAEKEEAKRKNAAARNCRRRGCCPVGKLKAISCVLNKLDK